MSTSINFADVVYEGILGLPQDLKSFFRLTEDPDLDDSSRVLACGVLLHVLSGANAIPGVKGTLALADDALLLRLVAARIEANCPEVVARHRQESPEFFEYFDDHLASIRDYLGDLTAVLDRTIDQLPNITHLGHSARQCAREPEWTTWLYDSLQEAIVSELEVNEDDVARAVKNAVEIRSSLKQRL